MQWSWLHCAAVYTSLTALSFGCVAAGGSDDADQERPVVREYYPLDDEPRLDAGSGKDAPSGAAHGEGGAVSLPVTLSWVALEADPEADSSGTVQLRLTNHRSTPITAHLVASRSSGVTNHIEDLADVVLEGEQSAVVMVDLLPEEADLGNVLTAMHLRVDATVVEGADVAVTDDAALGHYQPAPLYFHAHPQGFRIYGEDVLRTKYGSGLAVPGALKSDNVVELPAGVALEAVIVSVED